MESRVFALLLSSAASAHALTVMMNGLPGAMGKEIAAACLRRAGVDLAPYCLTGPGMPEEATVNDGSGGSPVTVKLYAPDADGKAELAARVHADYPTPGSLVCIDFTHPTAVNSNAEFYAEHALPYVMGTTGGDREALLACAQASAGFAVIAPNMAKQIVALQAALQQMATDFPGSFEGYALSVSESLQPPHMACRAARSLLLPRYFSRALARFYVEQVAESHQSTKADTSGTAKAISSSLAALSAETATFTNDDITLVREPSEQMAGGGASHRGVSPVPEAALAGHAFHTYSLLSADSNVEFQFRRANGSARTLAPPFGRATALLAERRLGVERPSFGHSSASADS